MITASEKLVGVFERMALQLGVRYDKSELRKIIAAADLVGGDPLSSLYRAAERYRVRLGVFDCSFEEAMQFVRQGYPVAIAPGSETEGEAALAGLSDYEDDWWVLLESSKRGILTWSTEGGRMSRKSPRALRSILKTGPKRSGARRRLIVAQPIDAALMGEHHSKPLHRFISLLRPEKPDILAILIFSIVVGLLGLATPLAVESLVNTIAFNRYLQPIIVLSLLLFVFLAFAGVLTVIKAVLSEIIQRRLFVRVAIDLGHRLSNLDSESLEHHDGRELVNRFLDMATIQKAVALMLLDGLTMVISVFIGMVVLAVYHPFLLGFDIALLLLLALLIFAMGRGAVRTSIEESKEKYQTLNWFENIAANPTAFRFHGGDQLAMDRTDQHAANYVDLRQKHFRILLRQIIFAVSVEVVASVILLAIGGWLVTQNELTLGQLVAAELIVAVIVGAFAKMGKHFEMFYDLMAAIDKIGHVLDVEESKAGGPELLDSVGPVSVELNDVVVNAGGKTIIDHFSVRAEAGNAVAVLGPPGSGKSVLLEALATMRPLESGSIAFNGTDLRQLDHVHFVRTIGYVRGSEIFEGQIDQNIDLQRPEITSDDVLAALATVGMDREVRELEDSVDTELLQGGRPLSSTQVARVLMARAIVARPPLVLIDGLMDGLPFQLAEEILGRLRQSPMPWTLLVATARPEIADLFVESGFCLGRISCMANTLDSPRTETRKVPRAVRSFDMRGRRPLKTATQLIQSTRRARQLAFYVAICLIFAICAMLWLPWQQTAQGGGRVIAFSPLQRAQEIKAPTKGVIMDVPAEIREGARVQKGDLLLTIQPTASNLAEQLSQSAGDLDQKLASTERLSEVYLANIEQYEAARDFAVMAADEAVAAAEAKLRGKQEEVVGYEAKELQAQRNYDRQLDLYKQGIKPLKEIEKLEQELESAKADLKAVREAVKSAKSELENKRAERDQKRSEAQTKVESARGIWQKTIADAASIRKEMRDVKIKQSSLDRNEVRAPSPGVVHRLPIVVGGQTVKEGDYLLTIVPDTKDLAVEMTVVGNDLPLVRVGNHVRLQFEGWPSLQFTVGPQSLWVPLAVKSQWSIRRTMAAECFAYW